MDLESLRNKVANVSVYDLKAGFRKAQNAVMNYTEMEANVREATNNEPWGASSSRMQEIANGTFNYATLNEIMPMIYKRFTEKTAEEWRQIYKALQLLEFLIKNGSERVIDDARSHLTLLKMLRQFHYIDQNGKDQGINVRNRAKELTDLLGDVDRIRAERKKARATRNKYSGVEGGMGMGGSMSGGSRYGGMGSDSAGAASSGSYGSYSGGVYGDGGGFGGQTNDYADSQDRRDKFEEYDEHEDGGVTSLSRKPTDGIAYPSSSKRTTTKSESPKKKEPEVDLLAFGDEDASQPPSSLNHAQLSAQVPSSIHGISKLSGTTDEDEFDDFQSATTSATSQATYSLPQSISLITPTQLAAPTLRPTQPSNFQSIAPQLASTATPTLSDYSNLSSPTPQIRPLQQQPRPTGYQAAQPNYFTTIQAPAANSSAQQGTAPAGLAPTSVSRTTKSSSGMDPFANLLAGGVKKPSGQTQKGLTMADMAKEKASAGIWGASVSGPGHQRNGGGGNGDLLG